MAAHAKTDKALWLNGRRRQKPIVDKPTIAPGRPKCPAHLCESAQKEFHRVSKLLGERKHETRADGTAIALYAETYARWVVAKDQLYREGLQIVTEVLDSKGYPQTRTKKNALFDMVMLIEKQLFAYCKELGLTPPSRSKIKSTVTAEPEKPRPLPGSMWEQAPHLFDDYGKYIGDHKEN
jgi:P27 family predicted phage terminase small subunit